MKRAKEDLDTKFSFQNGIVAESGVRTTGRVKKPKAVYDPSDNYVSRAAQRNAANAASTNTGSGSHNTTPISGIGVADSSSAIQNASTTSSVSGEQHQQQTNTSFSLVTADGITTQQSSTNEDFSKRYDYCSKCHKMEPRRGPGFKCNFLTCKTCSKREHIDCLPVKFVKLSLARKRFKCTECRACIVCVSHKLPASVSRGRDLIICTGCVDVYHPECHTPPTYKSKIREINWQCVHCKLVEKPDVEYNNVENKSESDATAKINNSSHNDSSKTTEGEEDDDDNSSMKKDTNTIPIKTVTKPITANDEKTMEPEDESEAANSIMVKADKQARRIDSSIVRKWSVEEVVKFFEKIYPKEANVFHDHDIDGASLLLLRRGDVIKRFNLKLGPSLRLYEVILILQTNKNDVQNAWQG